MSMIEFSPIILAILVVMIYVLAAKFDDWFRKSRELDKKIGKEYTILNQKNKGMARTYSKDGELVSETGLHDYYEMMKRENEMIYERLMERRIDMQRRALITQQQYDRIREQGRDIIGGAESHLKPVEPKGYDIKDQFDGVP